MQSESNASPCRSRYQIFIIVACSIIFVGYLFGQNLSAQWWIIDDHEIMSWIGQQDHLAITQIVPNLMKTEVGNFGEYPRFRPTYYILRLLESWAWGKHPEYWYGLRLVILLFFVITIWQSMTGKVGLFLAGLLTMFTITFGYWADIFARLGPGESYATLGLALFIIGCGAAYQNGESVKGWFLLFVGVAIAAGSKENFIVLILPMAFLFGRAYIKHRMSWATWLFSLLSLLWCAWIACAVVLATHKVGADVYGNQVTLPARLNIVFWGLQQRALLPLYLLVLLFMMLAVLFRFSRTAIARPSLIAAFSVLALICLYISQQVFYNAQWPTGTRYDLPGMLCWPLALLLIIWYLRKIQELVRGSKPLYIAVSSSALIVMIGAVAGNLNGISIIRQVSADNVRRTAQFTASLERIREVAQLNPKYPVVIQSDEPSDYEPIISLPSFLLSDGVTNERYLLWASDATLAPSGFEESLAEQLANISKSGLSNYYLTFHQLQPFSNRCISVILSGQGKWPCQIRLDENWRSY